MRLHLLLGVSVIALNIAPMIAPPAQAAPCPPESNSTITTDQSCISWTGGDLSINSGVSVSGTITNGINVSGGVGNLNNNGVISTPGYSGFYSNNGNIQTLTNTGAISGLIGINSNSTSISTIINDTNGTITGTYGLVATNNTNINSIENRGLISGQTAIFFSSATIGSLTNSGTIAGKIDSNIYTGLTITGSNSSSAYGLFTGSSGGTSNSDIGTISHVYTDLTFDSGYIWLNDNVNVGANHTVQVNNATIKLSNAITITGNYTQTGGGLVSAITSDSQYGTLNVSGQANISNTTLVLQGSNLKAGDSYTIVSVGNPSGDTSITSISVTGTNGLTATTTENNGGNLVVKLTADSSGSGKYSPVGQATGGVASPFGSVLDKLNGESTPQAQAFQSNVLAVIDSLPTEQQKGAAIKQLAPANAANTLQMSAQATSIVLGAVDAHQQLVMGGDGGAYAGTGKAAGNDTAQSALWGQFLGGSAHLAGSSDNDGFTSKSFGLTSGFDHMITPNLLGGVALSWLRSWTDGSNDSSGSTQRLDSYQLTAYSTYRLGRLALDGQVGVGWNHFDQKRNVSFLGQTASADYDGQQYMARARAGYDFSVGANTTLTPFASLRWIHARNESYDESGAGSANLSVDAQNSDVVTQELGTRAQWQFDTAYGTLSPEISAAWVHDYTDSAQTSTGQIGGAAYSVETEGLPSDGVHIGAALSLAATDSTDIRLQYDGELRPGYQSQTATLKASWNF
jgi:outer membrane autotransporter protein